MVGSNPSGTGAPNPGGDSAITSVSASFGQRSGERPPDRCGLRIAVDENDGALGHGSRRSSRGLVPMTSHGGGGAYRGGDMEISTTSRLARRLGSVLEPVVGQVYFSPECHANYVALGFDPSPGRRQRRGAPRRSRLLRQPRQPARPGARRGDRCGVRCVQRRPWSCRRCSWPGRAPTPATIRAARADGAVGQLRRLLGERPDGVERALELLQRAAAVLPINGRHLAAGVAALDVPDDPLAAVWHVGDFLREYRGDCHNAAWVAAGLSATDIGMLTELSWGMPVRSYSRTRGWTDRGVRSVGTPPARPRLPRRRRCRHAPVAAGSARSRADRGGHRRADAACVRVRSAATSRSCSTSWRRGARRSVPARGISEPAHTISAEN